MQGPPSKSSLTEESKELKGSRGIPSSSRGAESEKSFLVNSSLNNCGYEGCSNNGMMRCNCSPNINYCMAHYGQHEAESCSKLTHAVSPVPKVLNPLPYGGGSSSSSSKSASNQSHSDVASLLNESPYSSCKSSSSHSDLEGFPLPPLPELHSSPKDSHNFPFRKNQTQQVSEKVLYHIVTESQDMPRQCSSQIPEGANHQLLNVPFLFSEDIIVDEEAIPSLIEESIEEGKLDYNCEEPTEIYGFQQLLKQYNLEGINVFKSPWKNSFLSKLCSCAFEDKEIAPECEQILRRFITFGAVAFDSKNRFHSDLLKNALRVLQIDEFSMNKPVPDLTGHKKIQISLSDVLKFGPATLTLLLINFLGRYYKGEFLSLFNSSKQERCQQPFLCILIQITKCYLDSLSRKYFHKLFSGTAHSLEACFALYAGLVFRWFELYYRGASNLGAIISTLKMECERFPDKLNCLSIEKHRLANN